MQKIAMESVSRETKLVKLVGTNVLVEKSADAVTLTISCEEDVTVSAEFDVQAACNFVGNVAEIVFEGTALKMARGKTKDGNLVYVRPHARFLLDPATLQAHISEDETAEIQLDRTQLLQVCQDAVSALSDQTLVFGESGHCLIWSPKEDRILLEGVIAGLPSETSEQGVLFSLLEMSGAEKNAFAGALWGQIVDSGYGPSAIVIADSRVQFYCGYGAEAFTVEVGPCAAATSFHLDRGEAVALAMLLDRELVFSRLIGERSQAMDWKTLTLADVYSWPPASVDHGDKAFVQYLHQELLLGPQHIDWAQAAVDKRLVLHRYVDFHDKIKDMARSAFSAFYDGKPVMLCGYEFIYYCPGDFCESTEQFISDKAAYYEMVDYLNSITVFTRQEVEIEMCDSAVPIDALAIPNHAATEALERFYTPEAAKLRYRVGDEVIALVPDRDEAKILDARVQVLSCAPHSLNAQYVCQLLDYSPDMESTNNWAHTPGEGTVIVRLMDKDVLRLVSRGADTAIK